LFGKIIDQQIKLSEFGTLAQENWFSTLEKFSNVEHDIIQIMPDHMHAVLFIDGSVKLIKDHYGASSGSNLQKANNIQPCAAYQKKKCHDVPEISKIIGAYKSFVSNNCLKLFKEQNPMTSPEIQMGKIWHRSFWERVIRDEKELNNVRNYIRNNPINWHHKKFNQIRSENSR
jgi:REP element-mobilizing transposase RayT